MTKYPDLFSSLAAILLDKEIKSFNRNGKQFYYVTARTVMNVLDEVLGPENWWDEYTPHESSVLCRLTIRLPDGSTLTKCDAGGYAGMSDEGDDDKSGYSDAFKRAAVKFGVCRFLYRDGVANYPLQQVGATVTPAPREAPRRTAAPTTSAAKPSREAPRNPPSGKHFDLPKPGGVWGWGKALEEHFKHTYLNEMIRTAKETCDKRLNDLNTEEINAVCFPLMKFISGQDYYAGEFKGVKKTPSLIDTAKQRLRQLVTENRLNIGLISGATLDKSSGGSESIESLEELDALWDFAWIEAMVIEAEQTVQIARGGADF